MDNIDAGLKLVEEQLQAITISSVSVLQEASAHIIASGGKRLRPRIALLAYTAVGGRDLEQVIPYAAVVEMVHTASLVHDDINDNGDIRRGRPTVSAQWGNTIALLTGDFLFSKCLELLTDADRRILKAISQLSTSLVEGETLQNINAGRDMLSTSVYLEIVTKKTASLFVGAAEIGAIQGGGTTAEIAALREYGVNVGIGFQIVDDLLDLVGDEVVLGKPITKDLSQSKMNLATIYAATKDSDKWRSLQALGDIVAIVELLTADGAIDYARREAEKYEQRALEAIKDLSPSAGKNGLIEIAALAVRRVK